MLLNFYNSLCIGFKIIFLVRIEVGNRMSSTDDKTKIFILQPHMIKFFF